MKNKQACDFVQLQIEKKLSRTALSSEMKRWESHKIPAASCYQLTQVLTGIKEYMTDEGVYLARNFNLLAKSLGIHQQKRLIDLLCLSGSFIFICDFNLSCCYGFFSPYAVCAKSFDRFHVVYPELNQIPIDSKVTKIWEMLKNQALNNVSTEDKDENETKMSDSIDKNEGLKNAESAKFLNKKIAKFLPQNFLPKLYSIYNLHNSYLLTANINQINIPPSEDTLLACDARGTLSEAVEAVEKTMAETADTTPTAAATQSAGKGGKHQRTSTGSRKKGKKRGEKVDYGDAESFFHLLNEDDAARNRFYHPHRKFICQRYQLSYEESRIVLVQAVKTLLIPHLDQSENFRFRPHQSRIYQLNNYIKKPYYLNRLDELYLGLEPQIKAIREQRKLQQIQNVRQNCPLSPFEWTHPTSLIRHYEDPVNGVVDLPAEAPPRPSNSARWNTFRMCWEEATGIVTQPTAS